MNLQSSRISVIIPTHNRSELLKETVDSVLSQSCPPQEIIIVDDHSSSDHENAIENIAASNSSISLYKIKKKGVSAARNFGLEKADGDYILFIDDDDLLHPKMLETSLGIFHKNKNSDIVACQFEIFFSPGKEGFKYPLSSLFDYKQLDQDPLKLLDPSKIPPVKKLGENPSGIFLRYSNPINSFLIKKKSISTVRFSEDILQGEDILFLLSLAARKCRFIWHDKVHAFVRRHSGNNTISKMRRFREGRAYLEEALRKGILTEKGDIFLTHLKLFHHNFKIKNPAAMKYFILLIKSPILLGKECFRYTILRLKARKRLMKYYFMD